MYKPAEPQLEQSVDYVIGKEVFAKGRTLLKRGEAIYIQGVLANKHNIIIGTDKISARASQLRTGKYAFAPSGDYDGTPGSRAGKDENYAGFWTLVDAFIPKRFERMYVGLAANHMDVIRSHLSWHPVVVVERDKKKANELRAIADVLMKIRQIPQIVVINSDIFETLEALTANVIDLDLMCAFPEDPTNWIKILGKMRGTAVVNITTCIGRFVTETQYNDRTLNFRKMLPDYEIELVARSPFSYRDRYTPMRAERLVIRRK